MHKTHKQCMNQIEQVFEIEKKLTKKGKFYRESIFKTFYQ